MAMRIPAEQLIHDELTTRLFKEVTEKGYENVRASLPGLPKDRRPEKIYCERAEMFFSPDICAERGGAAYIFEVATAKTIDSPSTKIELETFAAHAKDLGAYFYLVVPSELQRKAQAILEGIDGRNGRTSFVLPT